MWFRFLVIANDYNMRERLSQCAAHKALAAATGSLPD